MTSTRFLTVVSLAGLLAGLMTFMNAQAAALSGTVSSAEEGMMEGVAKAEELNRLGVPSPRGKRWFPSQVIRYQDRLNPRC